MKQHREVIHLKGENVTGYYEMWQNSENKRWYWHRVAGNGAVTAGNNTKTRWGSKRAIAREMNDRKEVAA